MGHCLCKDEKSREDTPPAYNQRFSFSSDTLSLVQDSPICLTQSEVNNYVLQTLSVIRTKVDIEDDPPESLVKLNSIVEKEDGWIQLLKAFVFVIPEEEALGPAVMSLFLDDSPLPNKETMNKCTSIRDDLKDDDIKEHRNFMIVLGCLADKLAGPNSVTLLTDEILEYILGNICLQKPDSIILFSLIALEKFAHTSENKSKIKKKLSVITHHEQPLLLLEKFIHSNKNLLQKQIGFCAQWCLDNLLPIEGRKFTYTSLNLENINMMLNYNDTSEYLKLSPDGLTARCDSSSFESVRGTGQADVGAWYYEVLILTGGVMQIGWATKKSKFLNYEGYGIGDDEYSQSYDGCRQLMWYNADFSNISPNLPQWQPGDTVGCFLDTQERCIKFYLNGQELGPYCQLFEHASDGFFPAASFMAFQQGEFNFGAKEFKFPPNEKFQNFNEKSFLASEDKIIWPRPIKLKRLQRDVIEENTCIICCDHVADSKLLPCNHSGFCENCANEMLKMESCPICRCKVIKCCAVTC